MTYLERKLSLGLAPTALDHGFEPEFDTTDKGSKMRGYKMDTRTMDRGVDRIIPPLPDMSHLNPRSSKFKRIGSAGGKKKRRV